MICAIDSFLTAALTAEPPQLDVLVGALDLLVVAYNNTCQTEASEEEREVPKGDYSGVVAQIRERFPELGVYGTVFNPLAIPPEPPVVGDAADDIADIVWTFPKSAGAAPRSAMRTLAGTSDGHMKFTGGSIFTTSGRIFTLGGSRLPEQGAGG